jgi:hypothetical protein
MLGRRESEQLELPWRRPVHEPVPIGCVAAVGPGLSLAPLDLCWPVAKMHRVAGAARLGECGTPVEGAEVERDDGAGWSGSGLRHVVQVSMIADGHECSMPAPG